MYHFESKELYFCSSAQEEGNFLWNFAKNNQKIYFIFLLLKGPIAGFLLKYFIVDEVPINEDNFYPSKVMI